MLELQEDYAATESSIRLKVGDGVWIDGRLCIIRKSKTAIELALKKLKREARYKALKKIAGVI